MHALEEQKLLAQGNALGIRMNIKVRPERAKALDVGSFCPFRANFLISLLISILIEESQQGACGYGGTDNSCNIRTHGVHEQEVVTVVFQTEVVADAGTHRNGTHTGISDQWVQLLALWQEEVHQFHKEDAAG